MVHMSERKVVSNEKKEEALARSCSRVCVQCARQCVHFCAREIVRAHALEHECERATRAHRAAPSTHNDTAQCDVHGAHALRRVCTSEQHAWAWQMTIANSQTKIGACAHRAKGATVRKENGASASAGAGRVRQLDGTRVVCLPISLCSVPKNGHTKANVSIACADETAEEKRKERQTRHGARIATVGSRSIRARSSSETSTHATMMQICKPSSHAWWAFAHSDIKHVRVSDSYSQIIDLVSPPR